MKKIHLLIFILLITNKLSLIQAQVDADGLIEKITEKMNQVESYQADVKINIDVDFMNIDEREAKITYEKPDKFDIKAKGFLLLPKKGTNMEYFKLLQENHTAIYEKDDIFNDRETVILKIIPMDNKSDIVLAQLWIEQETLRIHKMYSYTKNNGAYTIIFKYTDHPYDLPDAVEVLFNIKNMMIPGSITGDFEALSKKIKEGNTEGKVTLEYSNYVVNDESP